MQPPDFQRFRAIMNGMAKMYDREIDGVLLDAYWLALRSWELRDFEQAAGHLMCHSKFMPRPADFTELRNAGRPTAGEAWAEVLAFVRKGFFRWDGGEYSRNLGVPEPPSMLSQRVVAALGGYEAIAMTNEDKLSFLERRFAEHFAAMSDADEVRNELPSIAGHSHQRLSGPNPIGALLEKL